MIPPVGIRCFVRTIGVVIATTTGAAPAPAAAIDDAPPPLHQRIDAAVSAQHPLAGRVNDLPFLRRVTLDLAGRIPTVAEARGFLADPAADKRARRIEQLLNGEEFLQHWATRLDVMFMERRGNQHVKTTEFRTWIAASLREKKPLNQLCAEMISADGTPEKQRPASAFFLERGSEPNLMAREVGRMFFGVDLQCAQCHDHPLIEDYHQSDYYGLYAFVSRTSLFRPNAKKPALLAETSLGTSRFKSVFTARESLTQPRVPGEAEIADPYFDPGTEYVVAPSKNVRGIPKYSRRSGLARIIADGSNELFRRNLANRVWAIMLGRGIVHPVDLHHSDNPPSNPQLLKLISDEFAATNFDLASFVREIALSQTYQAASATAAPVGSDATIVERRKTVAAEVAAAEDQSRTATKAVEAAIARVDSVFQKLTPLQTAWQKTRKAAGDLAVKRDAANKTLTAKESVQKTTKASRDALVTSETAIARAAAVLKDAELDKLLAQTKKLAAKHTASAKALDAEVGKLRAARDALQAKYDPARGQAKSDYDKLQPLLKQLATARARVIAAREERASVNTLVTRLNMELVRLDHHIDSAVRAEKIVAAQQAVPAKQTKLPALQAAVEQAAAEADAAAKALGSAQVDVKRLTRRRAAIVDSETAIEKSHALIVESIKRIEAESNDADVTTKELHEVAGRLDAQRAVLKTRSTALRDQLTQANQTAAQREQVALTSSQTLKTCRDGMKQATAEIHSLQEEIRNLQAAQAASRTALREAAVRGFTDPVLEPLTPEQFCWSMIYATGQVERQIAAERARLSKKKPLKPEELKDAARVRQRRAEERAAAMQNLRKRVDRVVRIFAPQSGQPQDFFATVDQALFAANGGDFRSWVAPTAGTLSDRLIKTDDARAFADELYLALFTREPSDDEVRDIDRYLKAAGDRRAATQEIVWALLTSAEFRFQQ